MQNAEKRYQKKQQKTKKQTQDFETTLEFFVQKQKKCFKKSILFSEK